MRLHNLNKSDKLKFFVALAIGVILVACSTTKRIPEGEYLYTGLKKINYITPDSVIVASELKSEVEEAVDVPPNNYFALLHWRYPFPLGLWVYNNWNDPGKGFKHWLYEKLVAQPVLVSDVRPEVRTRMIKQLMDNDGFFGSSVDYELIHEKNPKKAKIQYNIHTGHPYCFDEIQLLPDTTRLNHIIDSIASKLPYLQPGSQYCVDSLSFARNRIANSLRNRGYYFFKPEFIEYLADSIANKGKIALRMALGSNLPPEVIEPYKTGKVSIIVNRNNGHGRGWDTIPVNMGTLYKQMPTRMRLSVINDNVTFKPGKTFSVRDMDRTQSYLAQLGIFSNINIEAKRDTTSTARLLDVVITTTMEKPLEASIEVNATSKSNSYLGPGMTLGLTNKNIFGGGEQLSVQLTGSYEWQTGKNAKGGIFNSYEAGLTGTLAFPRLLAPRFIPRRKHQLNWTRFSLNADLLNRPHYFRMAQFNLGMSYDWMISRRASSTFTPFKLTYTKLMQTTADFDSIMAANPAVAQSFMSQFIPQMQYSYNYERRIGHDNIFNWTFTLQEAGNLFWSIYELCGKKGEKKLFGTPFSQFVKGQTQIVWNRRIGRGDSWLVTRAAVGAAHAYANSTTVPYAEQFYCGGANSVRAFTVRSLGPGSYHPPAGTPNDYFDQTGTFKFEANIEYRFPIFSIIHGAVFVDSGNVWLLKNDPQRPGGLLEGKTFFKDLALGTGAGIRLDFGMLIVRGDLGVGIHAPYNTGKKGYYNMTSFGNSLAFHLAIGYPF